MGCKRLIMFVVMLSAMLVRETVGHGAMIDPPARNYMGKAGFSVPINYDYNSQYCGGFYNLKNHGGKCGVCGDPWQGPRPHEPGGIYATDVIGRCYLKRTKTINVTISITAWHKGYFSFKMCPHNNPKTNASQSCFDQYPLQLVSGGYKYDITNNQDNTHKVQLKLPKKLKCTQCILQWTYTTGNSWGCDGSICGLGLGSQEVFINCADIAILSDCSTVSKPNTKRVIPETTKPSSGSNGKQNCKAAGAWTGQKSMDNWCVVNCNAVPPFCPGTHCICERSVSLSNVLYRRTKS
ncbi:hypothetical protein ACJMK2_024652 [Sinanodonta woodiana]|uniref:Chitin-binding type-4 domain-containing protein n=1 Tax=Sinanodonta woodiana TaxID=1069815 RepID=A0ABD3XEH6_SINWO